MSTQGQCYVHNVDQSIALQKYLLDCGFTWTVPRMHPDREYDIRSFDNLVVSWSNFQITADFPRPYDSLLLFNDYFEIRQQYEGWAAGLNYGI